MTLSDKDWQRLIDKIRRREVIPLIGPGVVTTPVDGAERLLLQTVVPGLLAELDQVELDRTREYADVRAVAREYAKTRASRADLLRDCRTALTPFQEPGAALLALASITDFQLYLSSTPDGLLANALARVRKPRFDPVTQSFGFCPNGITGHTHPKADPKDAFDIPKLLPSDPAIVYHLLGAHFNEDFALWEEDWLEYLLSLAVEMAGKNLKELAGRIQRSSLLLIGAPSDDWISRFLLRIARGKRLTDADQGLTQMAARRAELGEDMIAYFEQSTRSLRVIDANPCEFALELARRWQGEQRSQPNEFWRRLSESCPPRAVFISYDRRDRDAVAALGTALLDAGVNIWVDQRALEAGQNYRREIRRAVNDCAFFISLISTHSEEKSDPTHLLREERQWAANRHDDSEIFYLKMALEIGRGEIKNEPETVHSVEIQRFDLATLADFAGRVKRLCEQFNGPEGRPRR
jgi:hypothetical protein